LRIGAPFSQALRRFPQLIGDQQLANPFVSGCKDRIGHAGWMQSHYV